MTRLLFIFILAVLNCQAASHYIRAGASGAGNGSSWTDAWTTFGAATFTRGDTYFVAGGTYAEAVYINVNASGSTLITIKKANATDNSGDAGWSASYATTVAQINGTVELNKGYVVWDGVTGSATSGHGIRVYNAAFSNVFILDYATGTYEVAHTEIQGAGVNASTTAYVGLIYNAVASPSKNAWVHHCWIHEVTTNGVAFLAMVGTSYSDYGFLFENNFISETGLCLDPDNHGQAMQLGQASTLAYCIIRNNSFRNISGSAFIAFLTSGNDAVHGNIRVYNNSFYLTDTTTYPTISPGVIWHEAIKTYTNCTLTNLTIANNVFYNVTGTSNLGQIVLEISTSGNVAENNVWEGCHFTATHTGLNTQSNNGYYGNNGAGIPSGTTNQVNGSATTFVNPAAYNFALASGGYAISAGLNLYSTFTDYADGTARANAAFDLGSLPLGQGSGGSAFGGSLILGGNATIK
jgi:hypothetical protein